MEDEKKKESKPKMLSDEKFQKLVVDCVTALEKPGVSRADQLEASFISMVSIAIAAGMTPEDLLMFCSMGIVGAAVVSHLSKQAKGKKQELSYDQLLTNMPKNPLKN